MRFCESCRREVFFCASLDVAQTHAGLGDCIAIDPRPARRPGDLESDVWGSDVLTVGLPALE